jgi:hypothetical protein
MLATNVKASQRTESLGRHSMVLIRKSFPASVAVAHREDSRRRVTQLDRARGNLPLSRPGYWSDMTITLLLIAFGAATILCLAVAAWVGMRLDRARHASDENRANLARRLGRPQ